MMGNIPYAFLPIRAGQLLDPSEANVFTRDTDELGQLFWASGKNNSDLRLVRLVRNDSGGTLAVSSLVRYDVGAGDYGVSVIGVTNADGGRCAGVIEPEYKDGVPNGKWFRICVAADKIRAILGNVNSARIAMTPGSRIVPYTNGQFIGQIAYVDPADTPASQDALRDDLVAGALASLNQNLNVIGVCLDVTTNVLAERGAHHYIRLDCTRQ